MQYLQEEYEQHEWHDEPTMNPSCRFCNPSILNLYRVQGRYHGRQDQVTCKALNDNEARAIVCAKYGWDYIDSVTRISSPRDSVERGLLAWEFPV